LRGKKRNFSLHTSIQQQQQQQHFPSVVDSRRPVYFFGRKTFKEILSHFQSLESLVRALCQQQSLITVFSLFAN
jgi:hypothetical protein